MNFKVTEDGIGVYSQVPQNELYASHNPDESPPPDFDNDNLARQHLTSNYLSIVGPHAKSSIKEQKDPESYKLIKNI